MDRACERDALLTQGVANVLFGIRLAQRPKLSAGDGLGKREGVAAEEVDMSMRKGGDAGECAPSTRVPTGLEVLDDRLMKVAFLKARTLSMRPRARSFSSCLPGSLR